MPGMLTFVDQNCPTLKISSFVIHEMFIEHKEEDNE